MIKVKIEEKELDKLQETKKMFDRVMNYLDKKHVEIYKFIIQKEMVIIKKDLKELQSAVFNSKAKEESK